MKNYRYYIIIALMAFVFNSKGQLLTKAEIDHVELNTTDTVGNIILNTSGGTAPYTYTWLPGNSTSKDYTNAVVGTYSVTVKDATNTAISYAYNLGYKTDWINLYGFVFRHDSLTANNECCLVTRTALTKNTLPANENGWMQHVAADYVTPYVIGFLDSAYSTPWIYDIDFALHETSGRNLYAWSDGYFTWLGTVETGDVLLIERIGSEFNLKQNGTIIHTATAIANKKYKVKAISEGCALYNIGVSFTDTSSIERLKGIEAVVNHVDANNGENLGSIIVNVLGGSAPYTYLWNPGGITTKDLVNAPVGGYTYTVKDAIGDSVVYKCSLGYKTMWKGFYGTEYSNDTLKSDGQSGYYNRTALTINSVDAYSDGWLQYIAPETTGPYLIGFLDSSYTPDHITDLDFALHGTEYNDLYAWVSGNFIWLGSVNKGDVLRVERVGSDYNIRQNGALLYSEATSQNSNIMGKALLVSSPIARLGAGAPIFTPFYINYAVLHHKLNGGYYHIKNNTLYFKYNDQYNTGTLNYGLYDEKRNLVSPCTNLIRYLGDNRFKLDLTQCSGSTSLSGFYTLEVTNEKNEKSYLKIFK